MMNLTVPAVTGRLRRKSIAAEVAHCLPELRFDDGVAGSGGGGSTKHHAKRRGSLGGEPIRRPSLVSRWFKHISDAADAYKARTKGTHEYGDDSAGGGAGHPPKDSFETVTETQKIEQTSTPLERLERKDTQCRAVSSSAGGHPHQHHPPGPPGGPTSAVHGAGGQGSLGAGHAHPGGAGRPTDESRLSLGPGAVAGAGTPGSSANETEDNLENEEKEKFKRTQRRGSQECNGSGGGGGGRTTDDDEPDDEHYPRGQHPGGGGGRGSNNTRTITQQCSLVAPSEIHVSVSSTLTAEPILTPAEQLRRYDQLIQKTLASKQRVVCDMFKVPDEHFQAIADIAAQPEAPKEPTDIVLAAFAYGQTLMEILSEYTRVTESQQISAVSTSICDECSVARGSTKNHIPSITSTTTIAAKDPIESTVPTIGGGGGVGGPVPSVPSATGASAVMPPVGPTSTSTTPPQPIGMVNLDQGVNITEDEDGYCEIDEVRAAAVLMAENEKARKLTEAAAAAGVNAVDTLDDGGDVGRAPKSPESHIEINENYDSTQSPSMTQKYSGTLGVELCGSNRLLHAATLAPTVPCHLIANYVTGLNAQISQLLHKINEKDMEREHLRRENQHLRELLDAMHQERVLESQETNQEHQQQLAHGDEQQQPQAVSPSTSVPGSEVSQQQQQQQTPPPSAPEDTANGTTTSGAPTVPKTD
uniref:Uncharacterized protein n=1 Tax=Anopheles dirus TaxID=7168 RepID=A0A182NV54_9DIPT